MVNAKTGELVGDVSQVKSIDKGDGYIDAEGSKNKTHLADSLIKNPELVVSAYITTRDNKQFRLILSQGESSNLISRLYSKNLLIDLIVLILIMSLISYVI